MYHNTSTLNAYVTTGIFFNEELINVVDGAINREAEEERYQILPRNLTLTLP